MKERERPTGSTGSVFNSLSASTFPLNGGAGGFVKRRNKVDEEGFGSLSPSPYMFLVNVCLFCTFLPFFSFFCSILFVICILISRWGEWLRYVRLWVLLVVGNGRAMVGCPARSHRLQVNKNFLY